MNDEINEINEINEIALILDKLPSETVQKLLQAMRNDCNRILKSETLKGVSYSLRGSYDEHGLERMLNGVKLSD